MNILSLDTSSRAASCALLRDGSLAGEFFLNTGLTHSQTALPMVERLLELTGVDISDIDAFAVSTGPGSFTGLRIGIATVKGMASALEKPCAPVSTLLGLAYNAPFWEGYLVPVMDARRSQVYTAMFRGKNGLITREGDDEAISLDTLRERLAALAPTPVLLLGDGAVLASGHLAALSHVRLASERLLHQRAGSVAAAAQELAETGGLISAEMLSPGYLRLPQAERERLEKESTQGSEPV